MLRQIRDWLLRIPVLVVCAVAVVLSALFGLVADRAGESGVLVVPPLFALWVVTWALVLAHAHRAVARSRNSLVRFGTPIAAALVFVVVTAYAGQFIASLFSTPSFHISASCHELRKGLTNRWSQPLAVAISIFDFMKEFSVFATLAPDSGGSAYSR